MPDVYQSYFGIGTHRDNALDREAKGRSRYRKTAIDRLPVDTSFDMCYNDDKLHNP